MSDNDYCKMFMEYLDKTASDNVNNNANNANKSSSSTLATIDEVLWLLLFGFILINKFLQFYCKQQRNMVQEQVQQPINTSHANNTDNNPCQLI